jgi:hypothetical protein
MSRFEGPELAAKGKPEEKRGRMGGGRKKSFVMWNNKFTQCC